jgi:hypothetical protein
MYEFPSLIKNSEGTGLLNHYKICEVSKKFVLQTDNYHSYIVFADIDSYLEHFNVCAEPMFHELIFNTTPRKFFLDLDYETNITSIEDYASKISKYRKHINAIKDILVAVFNTTYVKYYITLEDILTVESHTDISTIDNYNGDIKLSTNLIIGKYLMPDQIEFVNFGKLILKKYEETASTQIIDKTFFSNTQRNFIQNRLIFNTKTSQSRYKYPIINGVKITKPNYDLAKRYIMQSNIGVEGKTIEIIEGVLRDKTKIRKTISLKLAPEEIQEILSMTSIHWKKDFIFRMLKDNIIEFDRFQSSYCDICDTRHNKDNTLVFIIEENGKIYKKCRRSQYLELIYRIKTDIPVEVVVDKSFVPSKDNKWKRYFPSAIIIDTDEQHVSDKAFAHNDINFVISEMKTGKSKSLIQHLSGVKFDKAVFISFRRTFSAEASSKYKSLGFVNYSDIEGEINLDKNNRIIIQVESLSRLNITSLDVDVLILDEIESIWSQFSSTNFRDYCGSYNAFMLLMKKSKRVIAMDANLGDRTARLFKRILPTRGINIYINRYNPNHDYEYNIVDKYTWLFKMQTSLTSDKKIAIFSNSLKAAKEIKSFAMKYIGKDKIKIYSSKTKESIKRLHFSDVNKYWSNYSCVICTPTVSAGVSFEADHFDYAFGIFTDRSCNVETCRQMLGRVRNVKSKEIYININTSYDITETDRFPTSIEVLKRNLAVNRREVIEMCGSNYNLHFMQYTVDDDGSAIYDDGFQLNIILENLAFDNHSRNSFYQRMLKQLSGESNRLNKLSKIVTGQSAKDSDIIKIKEMFAEVANETKKKTIKAILDAPTLTVEQFEDIKDKASNMVDVTSSEHNSMEQFIIMKATRVEKLDKKLVERFRGKNNIRRLAANRTILHAENIDMCLEKDLQRFHNNNSRSESVIIYWGNIHKMVKELTISYAKYTNGNIDLVNIIIGLGSLSEFTKMEESESLKLIIETMLSLYGILNLQTPSLDSATDIAIINCRIMYLLRYIYGFSNNKNTVKPMRDVAYIYKDEIYVNCKKMNGMDEIGNLPIVNI